MSPELEAAQAEVRSAWSKLQAAYHHIRLKKGTPAERRAMAELEAAFRAASKRRDGIAQRSGLMKMKKRAR